MVRRRSTVRFRKGALRDVHTSPACSFTFGSDSLPMALSCSCVRFFGGWLWRGVRPGRAVGRGMSRWRCWSLTAAAVMLGLRARSGRAGAGELAAPLAGARLGCGASVVLLPGLEGGQGALVAH